MPSLFKREEVIQRARNHPEPLGEVRRRDFIDQQLVTSVTAAVRAKGEGDTSTEALDNYAREIIICYYYHLFIYRQTIGKRYVQWYVEKTISMKYGVAFDTPPPGQNEAPADLAYTTLSLRWEAANDEALRQKREMVANGHLLDEIELVIPTHRVMQGLSDRPAAT